MFFNSIKEINRFRKEINRLLSKGMSNIYLKVTIGKKWSTPNFDFISLKSSFPGQFLGSSNSRRYHWILKLLFAGNKIVCGFSIILILKGIMTFSSQTVHAFCWTKI